MKAILKTLATIVLCLSNLTAAEADAQNVKIKDLSTEFWNKMTAGSFDEAKKSIFTKGDDPELENAELFAKMSGDKFDEMVKSLKEFEEKAKLKEAAVKGVQEQRGREVAFVTMTVWSPKKKAYGKMTIVWLKTKKSEWKIVDM